MVIGEGLLRGHACFQGLTNEGKGRASGKADVFPGAPQPQPSRRPQVLPATTQPLFGRRLESPRRASTQKHSRIRTSIPTRSAPLFVGQH
jgi:hypothetical protein